MLTNHPPPPRYIHTVSDKLNLCSAHSHYSPLTQIVEAQQFYISPLTVASPLTLVPESSVYNTILYYVSLDLVLSHLLVT